MPIISFTFPDGYAELLAEAFCVTYSYQSTIADPGNPGKTIPNPKSPAEFARDCVVRYCLEVLKSHQIQQAAEQARKAATEAAAQLDNVPVTHTSE